MLNPYTLLGGLATAWLFAVPRRGLHGAEDRRGPFATTRSGSAGLLSLPVIVIAGGFGVWTQLAYGKPWTWLALGVAVVALLAAVALVWQRHP